MNESQNTEQKSWICNIEDANDGSGDGILTFPPELIALKGWKEGTVLNLRVEEHNGQKVLVVTEKTNESN